MQENASPRSARFTWSDTYALGEPEFDQEHQSFVRAVDRLLSCPDGELLGALRDFEQHAIKHFDQENRQINSGYPAGKCHLDEHKAVLASVAEVRGLVAAGNLGVGRRLAEELARWFPEHTDAMDRGLVAWVHKQRLGGARVAMPIRRSSTKS